MMGIGGMKEVIPFKQIGKRQDRTSPAIMSHKYILHRKILATWRGILPTFQWSAFNHKKGKFTRVRKHRQLKPGLDSF